MIKLATVLNESEESNLKSLKGERCTIWYHVYNDKWTLESVRTSTGSLNKGYATKLLMQFLDMAKQSNVPVYLIASPLTKRTNPKRLIRFYQKFGFILTGNSGNFVGDPYMVKLPSNLG